jgi:TyrR family helix-turn-helix protein
MNDKNVFNNIVYKSEKMKWCIEQVKSIATCNTEILIYGEEGTEKDLIAKSIHNLRNKNNRLPFVSINCSHMPDSLFNIELFGRSSDEPGLLERTKDGTLYLEDISELSLYSQALLLEVIKNRRFRRIGECSETPVNCRIITSSKKDLLHLVKEKKFNVELYYLISVLIINIPPLRNRKDDIEILAKHFIDEYNKSHIYNKKFLHPDSLDLLLSYDWPGNTIELKSVIIKALHSSSSNVIRPNDIVFTNINPVDNFLFSNSLRDQIQLYEKNIVEQALKKYKSARKTADMLDVSHTTILKKIRKYRLEAYLNS